MTIRFIKETQVDNYMEVDNQIYLKYIFGQNTQIMLNIILNFFSRNLTGDLVCMLSMLVFYFLNSQMEFLLLFIFTLGQWNKIRCLILEIVWIRFNNSNINRIIFEYLKLYKLCFLKILLVNNFNLNLMFSYFNQFMRAKRAMIDCMPCFLIVRNFV